MGKVIVSCSRSSKDTNDTSLTRSIFCISVCTWMDCQFLPHVPHSFLISLSPRLSPPPSFYFSPSSFFCLPPFPPPSFPIFSPSSFSCLPPFPSSSCSYLLPSPPPLDLWRTDPGAGGGTTQISSGDFCQGAEGTAAGMGAEGH